MNEFITISDYDASIHSEILDAITRSDAVTIELAEDMAIEEMTGYLNTRYDCADIFAKRGDERNKLVVMMGIDIVLYHLHSAHNPMRFPEIRKDRYKRAIDWLTAVQKGQIKPSGLKLLVTEDGNTGNAASIEFTYEARRNNAF